MLKYHIRPLPYWVLTDLQPAFYDSESGTILQQTSRVYAKLQEVLKYYNDFTREVNRYIEEFETGIIKDFECFKNCITKTMTDYIESIDMKVNIQDSTIAEAIERQDNTIESKFEEQDETIANAINYMKTNLISTVTNLFNEALSNGDIIASLNIHYTPSTEALVLSIVAESEEE